MGLRAYLFLLVPRDLGAADEFASSETAVCFWAWAGLLTVSTAFVCFDSPFCFPSDISMYFSRSSPIFAFRVDVGIRLIRSSILVRRLCACRAYCARSFRARSVTGKRLMCCAVYQKANGLLSNCRLSISACFWPSVMLTALFCGL